ncbi:MAG: methionyl-tRNA formyltransferase [Lachnospiraceae bacterium]|nr:methionyl-tRNA formyltransferase [Lachnospiraceae bacterium]
MKVIFMGTPDFAVGALDAIVEAGHEVVLVVTQEDKPKGRGKEIQFTPVKEAAIKHGIEVYQPHRVKHEEPVAKLREYNADVFVVAAYGQILSKELLDMPKYGCVNIHASLLPKYRGAAPIQWSIIDGEKVTGVTTQMMAEGIDTGDILDVIEVEIDKEETGGSLFDKLTVAGSEVILTTLKKLEEGTVTRTPQDHSKSTYAKMLDKKMGNIDFEKTAEEIERLIRGLNPWPSAYTAYNGKTLKIWKAEVVNTEYDGSYGQIVDKTKKAIIIKTGKGALAITELQLEGKKRMTTEAFLCGAGFDLGEILGK